MSVGSVVEVLCFLIIQLPAQREHEKGVSVGGGGNTGLAPSAHRLSEGFRNSINNSSHLRKEKKTDHHTKRKWISVRI